MIDSVVIVGLLIHFLADFVCQRDIDARMKSSSNKHLLNHTITYSAIWAAWIFAMLCFSGYTLLGAVVLPLLFGIITFISHTATDYCTSRMVKYFFAKQDYHNGFVVIGFDQILHYLQLYYTYKLLLL